MSIKEKVAFLLKRDKQNEKRIKDLEKENKKKDKLISKLMAKNSAPNKNYLTKDQAAAWIGCSRRKIDDMIIGGNIHVEYPGSKACINKHEIIPLMKGLKKQHGSLPKG
ncbi:hypothetical protein [Candidatus Uabimicrobium amorphum]|uniref:Helix-turn-helix domain-containing protein n=1 Tax=Uabimicrobium amorphum TaxID=2596890 RepID=A0A5S9IMJ4_UABAM|nr:hypothetical protein [Candidatus Uabimicrobium amorphum]BBM84464.1 hypothetical protein UABAM_02825 [Candidatus Uabimicrobium amorphum]